MFTPLPSLPTGGQVHESLCRDLGRRLSLDQQRHKLDCGQFWLTILISTRLPSLPPLAGQVARISLLQLALWSSPWRLSLDQQRDKLDSGQFWIDRYYCPGLCRIGHESLCRNWRRCLSFDQQRHKLDCGQFWIDQY